MNNGIILSALIRLWSFLNTAYENSVYYKTFNKIADWVYGLYSRSFIYHYFSKTKIDAEGSLVSKFINLFLGFFHSLLHNRLVIIGKTAKRSIIIRNISAFVNSWYAISIRYYSMFLAAFVGFRLVMKRLLSEMVGPYTLILVMFAAIGIFIDVSPSALYEGSKLRGLFGMPDLPEKIRLKKRIKPHKAVTVALVCGSIAGILTLLSVGWIAIFAIAGVILLIAKPYIGVLLIASCFPFLPTMGVVALGIYLFGVLFVKYIYNENNYIKIDTFDIAILIMCAVIVYGVLNSHALKGSLAPAAVYIMFVSSFYVIRRMTREKDFLSTLLKFIVFVSAAVSIYGIYQKLTGQAENTWTDTEMFQEMGGRIYSTFGNPNVFGEYLLMVMPITLGLVFKSSSANKKVTYLGIFALQMICMVLTYSRGCWIGMAVSLAVMIVLLRRKLTSLMVFPILIAPLVIPQTILQRFMSIGNVADSSTSYRVYIWQGTMRMLKDFWYCGVGIGEAAFGNVYPSYSLNAVSAPHAHNLYLHIMSETGILGLATVVTLIVLFYKYISTAAIKNSRYKITAVSLGTAMIGYLIQGMFDNVWYNYRIYFFFFVMLALGAALKDVATREDIK